MQLGPECVQNELQSNLATWEKGVVMKKAFQKLDVSWTSYRTEADLLSFVILSSSIIQQQYLNDDGFKPRDIALKLVTNVVIVFHFFGLLVNWIFNYLPNSKKLNYVIFINGFILHFFKQYNKNLYAQWPSITRRLQT